MKSDKAIFNLFNNKNLFLIAGPCVVESEKLTLNIAGKIKDITSKLGIPFIFKASYMKANRTSGGSFRSIGIQNSLEILAKVREKFETPNFIHDAYCGRSPELVAKVIGND